MAEWIVRQWSDVGACWLQCPNCLTATRFDHHVLCDLYDPEGTKDTPNPKPSAKCESCDFVPYLPLELKKTTMFDVILQDGPGAVWAPVERSTTQVRVETYGNPSELIWRNLKRD